MSAHRTILSAGHVHHMTKPKVAHAASMHRHHQVVCRCGCRLSVMFASHYVQTPAVETVYRSGHLSIEGPGLAAVCKGQAHTDSA